MSSDFAGIIGMSMFFCLSVSHKLLFLVLVFHELLLSLFLFALQQCPVCQTEVQGEWIEETTMQGIKVARGPWKCIYILLSLLVVSYWLQLWCLQKITSFLPAQLCVFLFLLALLCKVSSCWQGTGNPFIDNFNNCGYCALLGVNIINPMMLFFASPFHLKFKIKKKKKRPFNILMLPLRN